MTYPYAALVEEEVTNVIPAELYAVEADAGDRAKVEQGRAERQRVEVCEVDVGEIGAVDLNSVCDS